ncbi:hypothetical protein, variant 1 [Aphanomyces astaci]|uniref:Uncharacterized protein n=1 Tax=Aphanomyces astaci TaxID=112090 RepID=W4H2L2_APHAT|nr:hypothetical protein, variant 1 [Aphanomyces astaci]ETV86260.1 hypothetical protein, variant 1 [Aphanomyces astaci]|eukprot:XP_009824733.1 hypothetical protein, variant 1 [Aphanomyces astaci]
MGSRNLAARESALLQQNDLINVASFKAHEEARGALRAMSKAVIQVNRLVKSGPTSDEGGRVASRAMSKAAVHVNALGVSSSGSDIGSATNASANIAAEVLQRSPSKVHLQGGDAAQASTPPDSKYHGKRNQSVSVDSKQYSGSRSNLLQSQNSTLNRSSNSLAVDQARREQAATLQHLEEQVAAITESNKATERATGKLVDQMDQMKADHVALVRKLEQIDMQLTKQKTTQNALEANYKGTEGELVNAHTALDEARRHEKHAIQSAKAVQVQYSRHDVTQL